MIKFINELKKEDLTGKTVLLRVDFNVPLKEGGVVKEQKRVRIANDFKIKVSRETINYLLENKAKILLISHLDTASSFLPITEEIGEILEQPISLIPHSEINSLHTLFQTSPILLLDNIRQDKREEENSEELAKELSQGFDFFVNDGFAVSHRRHALVTSITRFLPSYGGFLMQKEIENLSQAIQADSKGKILVLGGAKVSTKLPIIQNFLDKAEKILIGGALANDIWQAQGLSIGASLVDDSVAINQLGNLVSKLVLPSDILVSKGWTMEKIKNLVFQGLSLESLKVESYVSEVRNLEEDEAVVDIGPKSAKDIAEMIEKAEMVIWNGPFGLSEVGQFTSGTDIIAKAVVKAKKSIIGGGETIQAAAKLNLLYKYGYVSTGGGAMLEFLAGNRLPGLEALGYYDL